MASERLAPKLATAKRVGRRGRDGVQGGGGKGVHDYNRYLWRPVLVKIMTIKLHHKSILIQLQQILWTCCVFLSSLNNTFFSVFVIIFNNKSFCFNYSNTFFIHAMNYFSVVLRIIFPMCIKNYFLIGPWIIFRGMANLFFGLQCIAGLVFEVDWFESLTSLGDHFERSALKENVKAKHCQGKKRKRFSSFLQNLSRASSLSLVIRFSGPTI